LDYFVEFVKEKQVFFEVFKNPKAGSDSWQSLYFNKSYCINVACPKSKLVVKEEATFDEDKTIFDGFAANKEAITERLSNFDLIWERKDNKKGSSISIEYSGSVNIEDRGNWDSYCEWIMKTAIELKKALDPYYKQ
jgi:hypothetical protein